MRNAIAVKDLSMRNQARASKCASRIVCACCFFGIQFCQLTEYIDKSCENSKERLYFRQLCHT